MKKLLKGAKVIDPSQNIDAFMDILIIDDYIADIKPNLNISDAKIINLSGMTVTPGLIDIHVHFREPGYEYKEDIESGSMSAAAGGFTAVACMPNTNPPIDNSALIEYVKSKASQVGKTKILPIGCVTKGQEGEEITEMGDMAKAGAVAFSDDGKPVANSSLMRKAMVYAAMFDKVIIDHCEDPFLFEGGQINEGRVSTQLGLAGISKACEEIMVARDILIAKEIKTQVHIAHISTKGSVELVRSAKSEGVRVTCEVTPHHLTLTEEAVMGYNTNAKVNPPLRTQEDINALLEGLKDGTIDAIATDHAPHHFDEKDLEFDKAAFGLVGLETALGVILTNVVEKSGLPLNTVIEKMTIGPAKVLGLDMGTLRVGAPADITVIDTNREWIVDKDKFFSKGRNTPFDGFKLKGKAVMTIADGNIIYSEI